MNRKQGILLTQMRHATVHIHSQGNNELQWNSGLPMHEGRA